ncbi:MAG: hypothetical protein PUB56_05020 [Paraprevotella sp.]|nr:hypothetical protein [Paraprevotella sp.]
MERKGSLHARISASLLVKGEENTGISEEQTIPSAFFVPKSNHGIFASNTHYTNKEIINEQALCWLKGGTQQDILISLPRIGRIHVLCVEETDQKVCCLPQAYALTARCECSAMKASFPV